MLKKWYHTKTEVEKTNHKNTPVGLIYSSQWHMPKLSYDSAFLKLEKKESSIIKQ